MLNPQLVQLSVAADDYDGRLDPAVLEVIEGRNLLRMDQDGEQMWVRVEKR